MIIHRICLDDSKFTDSHVESIETWTRKFPSSKVKLWSLEDSLEFSGLSKFRDSDNLETALGLNIMYSYGGLLVPLDTSVGGDIDFQLAESSLWFDSSGARAFYSSRPGSVFWSRAVKKYTPYSKESFLVDLCDSLPSRVSMFEVKDVMYVT